MVHRDSVELNFKCHLKPEQASAHNDASCCRAFLIMTRVSTTRATLHKRVQLIAGTVAYLSLAELW